MSFRPAPERIQKVLSRAGIGSRREIEKWILAGRIKINGQTAIQGDHITPGDRILIDGKPVKLKNIDGQKMRILAYHKPVGEVCTRRDEKDRPTVFRNLPRLKQGKWINVGRLDINTSGLLLFTNNGEIANKLMHPSTGIDREYAVRVRGRPDREVLKKLRNGITLDNRLARFTDIVDSGGEGSNHWYHVVIMEGRNREVRRLWESQGIQVSRLSRVRFGPVFLDKQLRPGQYRELESGELEALLKWIDIPQSQDA